MLCTPTICNIAVTKTLIKGGAGLNVLSVEAFDLLHVPHGRLCSTKPFSGVVDGSTCPLGQIRVPVTFCTRDNYCTELIDFDIARIGLPYNAIFGYPALAKFMAATHQVYNLMKMLGSSGIITVPCEERDVVCSLEHAFQAASIEDPGQNASWYPPEVVPKKMK